MAMETMATRRETSTQHPSASIPYRERTVQNLHHHHHRKWTTHKLDKWLHGHSPGKIAPALFRLVRRKHITVEQALDQGRWLRGLQRIVTSAEVTQFVNLWLLLNNST
jgi:hypothetical protein